MKVEIMNRELHDLLPQGAKQDPTAQQVANLISEISNRKVPVNSFSRIWNLGSMQARVTAGYLAYWLRSRFSDTDKRQQMKNEAHLAAALKLFGTMGYLRGAVMKIGQMLANLPEVVPEEFSEVLSSLHFEAPPMHFSMVREVFLDEFGAEPEELFASFDRQAFAAASLGQVHRARLKTGEEVAVKIQYPGIATTIKADLRNLRLLLQPMCLTDDWPKTLEILADIEQMLLQETDYEKEAAFGKAARALFTEADKIVVPQIYDQYSSRRVLTTEFLEGCHLDSYLASNPDQKERDHFTDLLTVATIRVYYRLHWVFADPHPGNLLFMPGGRLGMIDFGCTRALTDEEWDLAYAVEEATLARDDAMLDQLTAKACQVNHPAEMAPEKFNAIRRGVDWQMEPWLKEGPFDFGDKDFFLRGIDSLLEMFRKRCSCGYPVYLWTNRFIIGGRAVCYKLGGRADFRGIKERESRGSLR